MDPAAWRKRQKLSLRSLASRLGVASPQTVGRYETGEREAPNSVALGWEHETNGAVTSEDLARVRRRYLEASKPKAV